MVVHCGVLSHRPAAASPAATWAATTVIRQMPSVTPNAHQVPGAAPRPTCHVWCRPAPKVKYRSVLSSAYRWRTALHSPRHLPRAPDVGPWPRHVLSSRMAGLGCCHQRGPCDEAPPPGAASVTQLDVWDTGPIPFTRESRRLLFRSASQVPGARSQAESRGTLVVASLFPAVSAGLQPKPSSPQRARPALTGWRAPGLREESAA